MSQRVAQTVLSYKVDTSSVQQAVQANAQVAQSFDAVAQGAQSLADVLASPDAAQQLGLTTDELAQLQQQLGLVNSGTQTLVTQNAALAQSYNQVTQAASQAQSVIRDIGDQGNDVSALPDPGGSAFGLPDDFGMGGGGGGSSYGQSRAIRSLGSLAGGSLGGGIGDVSSIVRLTAAFGPMGAAAGIVAVAFSAVTNNAAAAAKAIQDSADAYQAVVVANEGKSPAQIQADLQKAQLDVTTKQQLADQANAQFQARANVEHSLVNPLNVQNPLVDIVGSKLDPTFTGLQGAADDANTALKKAQDNLSNLEIVSGGASGATAVLTDAVKTLVKDGLLVAQDAVKKLTSEQVTNAATAVSAQQMTQAQRADKIQQDLEAQAVLAKELSSTGLTTEAHAQLQAQYDGLTAEIGILAPLTNTYADQLAKEEAAKLAITTQNDNYLSALKAEGTTRDQIAATTADIAQARSDAATKQAADYQNEQAKIATIQADGATKQQEIAKNNADAIAKIQRDSGQALANDIGDRDALQYVKDKQNEANKLADQATTDQQQIAAQQTQQAQAVASAQDAYATQQKSQQAALATEVAAKEKALKQEQVDLANEQVAEESIALTGSGGQQVIHTQMWTDLYGTAQFWAGGIASAVDGIFGGSRASVIASLPVIGGSQGSPDAGFVPPAHGGNALPASSESRGAGPGFTNTISGTAAVPGTGITIGSFAVGTPYVPRTGAYTLHQGEAVIPAGQNRAISFAPVINATSKAEIMRQAAAYLKQVLTEAGVA